MIHGVLTKPLKVIPDERGWLMEMLRDDDPFYSASARST
jgi:dTDP-4-dehydrorhamnose 3,5-epimerase